MSVARAHFVLHGLRVVGQLQLRVVDAAELPEHLHEVGLALEEALRGDDGRVLEGPEAHVLHVQHPLGLHELLVEARQPELRGQQAALDVEEAVVVRGEPVRFGLPALGPGRRYRRAGSPPGNLSEHFLADRAQSARFFLRVTAIA